MREARCVIVIGDVPVGDINREIVAMLPDGRDDAVHRLLVDVGIRGDLRAYLLLNVRYVPVVSRGGVGDQTRAIVVLWAQLGGRKLVALALEDIVGLARAVEGIGARVEAKEAPVARHRVGRVYEDLGELDNCGRL